MPPRERLGVALMRALRALLRIVTWPLRLHRKLRRQPLRIACFGGYGTGHGAVVRGRLTDTAPVGRASGGRLRRLRTLVRRMSSPPVPRARVGGRLRGRTATARTSSDGLFTLRFDQLDLPERGGWEEVELEAFPVRRGRPDANRRTQARDRVLIPSAGASLGIISDIDDTVVYTGVANKLAMMWRLFATEAGARTAFPGVGELYRALHRGGPDSDPNPIFYVSRGPWSIHPVLEEFFQRREIPIGPILLLRDWGIHLAHPWPRRARDHKQDLINELLETYPHLPFVLIGDSGQHDPKVYAEATERWGSRIACSYIRDVTRDPERSAEIHELARRCAELGSEMVLAEDSTPMAEHAARRGFILSAEVSSVRAHDQRERQAS